MVRRLIVTLIILIAFPGPVWPAEQGRLYSSRMRAGSAGDDVQYFLLSSEKSIVGNSIVAQGRIRELVISENGKRRRKDLVFTFECAMAPQAGPYKIFIQYGKDLQMIDPLATDVSMADKPFHDLWRAVCKGDFSGGA